MSSIFMTFLNSRILFIKYEDTFIRIMTEIKGNNIITNINYSANI